MQRGNSILSILFALTAWLIASPAAASTIQFSLAAPNQTAAAGDISFVATITAPFINASAVYLNADAHIEDTGLVVDDTGFFVNFPLFLMPGQSATAVLFTVNVSSGPGIYHGFFDILGGQDASRFDLLGSTSYTITAANVPEPGTLGLLTIGALGLLRRR